MPERVLVTGASGLVGRALVRRLTATGWLVRALVHHRPAPEAAESIDGDLRDEAAMRRAVRDCDVVVHAAGPVSDDPLVAHSVHVDGTRALVQAVAGTGVRTFVHVGTTAIYARGPLCDVDEDVPLEANGPYAEAKLLGERIVRERLGARATVVRPVAVYESGRCALADLVREVLLHQDVPLAMDVPLELVHVEDVASALVAATAGRGQGGTFHVAGAPRASFHGVMALASAVFGVAPRWRSGPNDRFLPLVREASTVPRSLSIARARSVLGYAPRCDWHLELRVALQEIAARESGADSSHAES